MITAALYATDLAARQHLERLAGGNADINIVGSADNPATLARLLDDVQIDIVIAEPRALRAIVLAAEHLEPPMAVSGEDADVVLTPRELEVLAALADGASNKVIARRLGISFHTVKFHVASILAKLDADSRTEAVAQAARQGLVML